MSFDGRCLATFIVILGLTATACSSPDVRVERRLIETVKRGPGTQFSMRDLTPFEWERMHVFPPFITHDEIEDTLGFKWGRSLGILEIGNDNVRLVVFVQGKRVVAFFTQKMWNGAFEGVDKTGLSPEQAIFRIEEQPREPADPPGQLAYVIRKI